MLDAFGIAGKPEDLDPDDELGEWVAGWCECYATTMAAELSRGPTEISTAAKRSPGRCWWPTRLRSRRWTRSLGPRADRTAADQGDRSWPLSARNVGLDDPAAVL